MQSKETEWPGRWSLANTPDVEIGGTLRLESPLDMQLELLGAFPGTGRPQFDLSTPLVAHGVTTQGDEVTVEVTRDIIIARSGFGTRKTYEVRRVIRGAQLDTLDPLVMSVEFGLSRLHDWVQPAVFALDESFEDFPYGARYTLSYQDPAPITLLETNQFILHLLFWSPPPFPHPRGKSASLRTFCSLRIDSLHACSLSSLLPIVGQVRSLLSFATSTPNSVSFLAAFTERDDTQPVWKRVNPNQRLEFFPVDDLEDTKEQEELLHPHQMLFTLNDDREESLAVTRKWLTEWPRLGPLVQLFLGATQVNDIHQEHTFLSVVQALEGFHRLTFPNQLTPLTQHRERVKRIVVDLEPADRDFVKRALQYSNEPSLRDRLDALLTLALGTVPGFISQRADFVKRTVATRHYFSHFAPGLRAKAASSLELYGIGRALATLFEIVTLLHFGWSEARVRSVVERSLGSRSTRGVIRFVLENRWGKV
jgi:ApeA N-terminal domain 1